MEWKILLQDTRFRPAREPIANTDGRNHFENDYSRLISSAAIRRLQDKTQVFPLQQSDFIRTRLTHSLEVSSIAKSIGKSVEKHLKEIKLITKEEDGLLPSLLMTCGLIHDLGNPPYGHFGETAIKKFFVNFFKSHSSSLSNQEKEDLQNFDGNVQTFRICKKLSYLGDEHSFNLTFPTLASVIKYPQNSIVGNKGGSAVDIAYKKFGYFVTEEKDYLQISDRLQLNNRRHPATFLLEAADDIAYSAADIEDGIKLGILTYDIIYEIFNDALKSCSDLEKGVLKKLEEYKNEASDLEGDKLSYIVTKFRIYTQGIMIKAVIDRFRLVHDEILNGTYSKEILMDSDVRCIRDAFKSLSKIVFSDSKVIQAEVAGNEILTQILSRFANAVNSKDFQKNGKDLDGRLFNMISSSLRYIYYKYPANASNEYLKFQLIVDFVSGMTDTYALNFYKKLVGLSY